MKINNDIKLMFRIAKIELNSMFFLPVAWLVLLIFVCQVGYSFVEVFGGILERQDLGRGAWSVSQQVFGKSMSGILPGIQRYIYLYIPLVTMGLMSREFQTGSIKLLYSSPIKNSSIILGKFLSMVIYGGVLIGVIGMYAVFTWCFVDHFDAKMVCVALLGLYLLVLSYSAIGLFMSSLTKYQVVAAIGTLAMLAFLNNVDEIGQSNEIIRDITYWLALSGRARVFLDGLFTSEDFLYFVIVIILFLSLSIFKLNTEKSVMSLKVKILKYSMIVGVCLFCGYVTTFPQLKYYWDATYTQNNTLGKESQNIMKNIKDRLTITTYVNLFDDDLVWSLPQNRNYDKKRLEKYIRFKPDTKMKYVYYYAPNGNKELETKYPGMSDEEKAKEICKIYNLDLNLFLKPDEIKQFPELEPEKYEWIRVIEDEHGHKSIMRMFNDNQKMPTDNEMSVVFNTVVNPRVNVAFAKGYGAREISHFSDRSYYLLGYDQWFRHSLLNLGFAPEAVSLDNAEDLNDYKILVVTDINESLSQEAVANVKHYIDCGGNLFILGNYKRHEALQPILDYLGVRFHDGILVEENEMTSPINIFTEFTDVAASDNYFFRNASKFGYGILMPTALAIDYSSVHDFKVKSLLETSENAWPEVETEDFVDGDFICNPNVGEKRGKYSTMISMERQLKGNLQKIIIAGDADFIANQELLSSHPGVNSSNYSVVQGVFRWFSDDQFPIVDERIEAIDNKVDLPKGFSYWLNMIFMVLLPLGLITIAIILIVKRQRK